MTTENKIKCVLIDFEINKITLQEATKQILLLLNVVGSVCDCVIPKPKDPYHELDRKICRDCNGNIKQTDL